MLDIREVLNLLDPKFSKILNDNQLKTPGFVTLQNCIEIHAIRSAYEEPQNTNEYIPYANHYLETMIFIAENIPDAKDDSELRNLVYGSLFDGLDYIREHFYEHKYLNFAKVVADWMEDILTDKAIVEKAINTFEIEGDIVEEYHNKLIDILIDVRRYYQKMVLPMKEQYEQDPEYEEDVWFRKTFMRDFANIKGVDLFMKAEKKFEPEIEFF